MSDVTTPVTKQETEAPLGFSGRIARLFLANELTPLIALALMLLGVFAVLVTPREEEPQIDVTMANVIVPFPGASSAQVESLVASPMEQVLGEIDGVEHLYSVSRPGVAILTVQFKVGVKRNDAIVRLYNSVYSNNDWRPQGLGVLPAIIKPKGIDDVPIMSLTLWTRDANKGAYELKQVAHGIETELKRVVGTRNVYTIGGPDDTVHVLLDPARLSGYGLTALELQQALQAANVVVHAGLVTQDNHSTPVQAGEFLAKADDVAGLIVGLNNGKPVYLQDVADIQRGPAQLEQVVKYGTGAASADRIASPAVTIAISKQPGRNAIEVTNAVHERMRVLVNSYLPDGVEYTITRNYGETANDKAEKLIHKLMFATVSVIVLVLVAVGWREAVTVGAAVIITLAATLFASWAYGFTINRVSLFALIFAIGILVDDAIVVVENIHRHFSLRQGNALQLIPGAVDEVGGPTILATFTVIAALLPMAFVSGLMGPYMSPIPINASMGMVISLAVALVITPWVSRKLLIQHSASHGVENHGSAHAAGSKLDQNITALFEKTLRPFLSRDARAKRHKLYWSILGAILVAISLAVVKLVVLKMLPFDNKSEFQIVVNMPEGTALEKTTALLDELADRVAKVPEVTDYQIYSGTSAPINFNGLVRQYYLRSGPLMGDIQVNLVDKHQRKRKSHDIALAIRPALVEIGQRYNAVVQVVEVPPGPPVQSPLVAEIYGPSYDAQRAMTADVRKMFDATPDIVDVDDTNEAAATRYVLDVDRDKAALFGVSQASIASTLALSLGSNEGGSSATYLRAGQERYPIPVRIELPVRDKAGLESVLALEVPTALGKRVAISEFASVKQVPWDGAIYHKDLLPVTYVMGDMAGKLDSPLYGMFDIIDRIKQREAQAGNAGTASPPIEQRFISQPDNPNRMAIKWDGEWQITYETFRDMGAAYSVGLLLIYLLVVAQFRSYAVPLIIMAPIPLTLIGIMPGHALLRAQFTATSMIGMIALAGIIVRNSILLVDFINLELANGKPLAEAVMQAAIVRTKPIVLTGLAAMMGAFFILDDPIFNGLAISLIFGILVSTLLTLVVIPVLYFSYLNRQQS